jgi:hypothetical protein
LKTGQIEPMIRDHLDECARLLVSAFNAEPYKKTPAEAFYKEIGYKVARKTS